MEEHERKSHPINRNIIKLGLLITGTKGVKVHKMYHEDYFKKYWLSRRSSNRLRMIARLQVTKQAIVELTNSVCDSRLSLENW